MISTRQTRGNLLILQGLPSGITLNSFRPQFVTKFGTSSAPWIPVLKSPRFSPLSTDCPPEQPKNLTLDWLFTPKKAVSSCGGASLDQVSAAEVFDRVMARLIQTEAHERDPHFVTDYRIARLIVAHCWREDSGACSPALWAWLEVLQCRPEQAWLQLQAQRKEKLGAECDQWFDADGNLRPEPNWSNIPDYDPTISTSQLRKFPSLSTKSQKAKEGIA